jgi:hypothetical protein
MRWWPWGKGDSAESKRVQAEVDSTITRTTDAVVKLRATLDDLDHALQNVRPTLKEARHGR